jgi:hypothetical protein
MGKPSACRAKRPAFCVPDLQAQAKACFGWASPRLAVQNALRFVRLIYRRFESFTQSASNEARRLWKRCDALRSLPVWNFTNPQRKYVILFFEMGERRQNAISPAKIIYAIIN